MAGFPSHAWLNPGNVEFNPAGDGGAAGSLRPTAPSIASRLIEHALNRGAQTAFHIFEGDQETILSYEDLLRQASAYAEFLRRAGVQPGELVFFCLKHGADCYTAYLGAMLLGAVPSFLAFPTPKQDPQLYWSTHRSLFHMVGGRAVLTYAENESDLAAVLPPDTRLLIKPYAPGIDPRPLDEIAASLPAYAAGDTALVQFSSGTTGLRKGVALSHQHIAYQVESYSAAIGAKPGVRIASWLPLYHDMGLMTAFLIPVSLGGTVVSLDPFEWVAAPHRLFELMDRHACTHAWLPNFAFNHLVRTRSGEETYRLDHVRALISCSEPCKHATFERFAEIFAAHGVRRAQLQTSYAMAETVFAISQSVLGETPRTLWVDAAALADNRLVVANNKTGARHALLSNGPPIHGAELRIDGEQIGEIQVRGRFLFDGYLKAPEVTAEAFVDGWYRTGDIGCLVDGEIYIVGRLKDIIIFHGRNYYAHDIEAIASTVPGIKAGRSVALGVWNEAVGSEEVEIVAECEQLAADAAPQIKNAVKSAIARQLNLTIARVHLVDPGWLVKTTSGKISRKENLAKLLQQREAK